MSATERWGEIEQLWCGAPGAGVHAQAVILSRPGERGMVQTVGLAGASSVIFAMLIEDRLVVRLPPEEAAELIEAGVAQPSEPGRAWVAVGVDHAEQWAELVRDACWHANPTGE